MWKQTSYNTYRDLTAELDEEKSTSFPLWISAANTAVAEHRSKVSTQVSVTLMMLT
jgi:hypothetical protein